MGWSKCSSFSVEVKGKVKDVISEAAKKAKQNDVVIKGDEKGGTVIHSDKLKGTFSVDKQKITFDLEEDSVFLECKKIEKVVNEYFKGK